MTPRLPVFLIFLLTAILALSAFSGVYAADGDGLEVPGMPVPEDLRNALLQGSVDSALEQLDELEQEQADRRDDWLVFRSVILQRGERFEEALEALKVLEATFPTSPWYYKARLTRSKILMRLERYGEAQKIIEEETSRLRSGKRIEALAKILIEVADRISKEPDPTIPDPKEPQYARARQLYTQAADLAPPVSLLEESLYGLVRCSVKMQIAAAQLIKDADRYLATFDPRNGDGEAGTHLFDVLLARAKAKSGVVSRRELQDLVAVIDASLAGEDPWGDRFQGDLAASLRGVRGDALLAIVGTYSSVDLRIAALRRFIDEAPDHPERIRSGFRIGEMLRDDGQSEAALSHWRGFIEAQIPGDAALLEQLKRSAQFKIGHLLWQMEQFDDSRAAFVEYGRRAPDGPDWAASQQAIINIDARIGESFLDDSQWQDGRNAIGEFASRYTLNRKTLPLLLRSALSHSLEAKILQSNRTISELSETERTATESLFEQSIADLKRLSGKYPDTSEGVRAKFNIAMILETSLIRLEESVIAYRECFGTSVERPARERLRELTQKSLQIDTDRLLRSNEAASFSLDTRNIEKVEVKIYPLDIEAYFRKYHSRDEVEQLDLDLIDPWKTVELEIDNYAQYRPCHQLVELPVEGSGTWAVMVSSEKLQATTLVVRTDLDIIVKAGRREVLVYAQDMLEKRPAAGVDVLIAIPGADDQRVLQEVKTGSDGIVRIEYQKLAQSADVKVLALRGGDSAVTGLGLDGTIIASGVSPRGQFLTDRATYRPGDTVYWRAVVRDVVDGRWHNPAGLECHFSLLTPGGVVIHGNKTLFRPAGTVSDSYTLPVDAPHGSWIIVVRSPEGIVHRQSFNVENITPLAVDLRIEPQRMVYVRGEMIEATISARTWYGEPLAGTAIVVHFNDGHEERFVLDEEGQVQIEQDSRDELGSEVRLMVQIPEYGLSRAASVILADSMWQLALQIPRENGDYIVGESVPVMVTATDAAGEPVERDVKVRLVRRTRSNGRWVENTLEERQIHTAEDGRAEVRIPLTSAGSHSIVAEGLDRIGNRITSRIGVTVSGDDEQRGLIWLVEKTRLDVGEKVELDLQNTRTSSPALLTIIGDGILQYRVVDLSDGR
ncbi:MAG: MG2 domain-containing protein, partial [Planctomycetota bacterium]